MNCTVKTAAKVAEELSQMRTVTQNRKEYTKARLGESLKQKWESKVMHGHYIRSTDKHIISEEDTFLLLSRGDLKPETETEIIAAHNQTLQTNNATKILQTETDGKCTLCQHFQRIADHGISACPILAKEHMTECSNAF
jgi:hypothetical protein